MRVSPPSSFTAWTRRFFRPWLIASGLGAVMGWSLLHIGAASERAELPDSYAEPAPRAASHEWLSSGALTTEGGVEGFALPPSVSASSSEWFSPAAPIAAEAVPSDPVFSSEARE